MALRTVGEILAQVRVLLQDEDQSAPYRYSDASLVQALNSGLLDSRRLRPDLFHHRVFDVPQYTVADMGKGVDYEPMYVPALINHIVGLAQLRDAEETTDARAAALMNTFTSRLITGNA